MYSDQAEVKSLLIERKAITNDHLEVMRKSEKGEIE